MNEQDKKQNSFYNKLKKYHKKRKDKKKELEEKRKKMTPVENILSGVKTIIFALLFVMIVHSLFLASFIVPTGSMENTVMTGDFLLVNKLFYATTPQIIPFFNIPLPYANLGKIKDPKKGDVIVFVFPGDRDKAKSEEFQYYLKRCVAEPGDTLKLVDNVLYVNNIKQPLPPKVRFEPNDIEAPIEMYSTFPVSKPYTHRNYGPIRVPKTGDTIHINNEIDFYDGKIFIEREGHTIDGLGDNVLIDNKETNMYIVEQDYYFGIGDNRDRSLDSRYGGFIPRKAILGSPIICWMSGDMFDEYNAERSIFGKIANIRGNRIGRTIN